MDITSSPDSFKIIFSGGVEDENQKEKLGIFLCKLLNVQPEKWEKLFDGRSYSIFKGLSETKANDIHDKLKSRGVITKIIVEKQVLEEVTSQEETKHSKSTSEKSENKIHLNNHIAEVFDEKTSILLSVIEKLDGSKKESAGEILRLVPKSKSSSIVCNPALILGPFYYFINGISSKGIVLWSISLKVFTTAIFILYALNIELNKYMVLLLFVLHNLPFYVLGNIDKFLSSQRGVKHYPSMSRFHTWYGITFSSVTSVSMLFFMLMAIATLKVIDNGYDFDSLINTSINKIDKNTDQPTYPESKNDGYFDNYEELRAYSESKYGKKNGVLIHEIN